MSENILITGAFGFFGKNLAKYFKGKNFNTFGIGYNYNKNLSPFFDKVIDSAVTLEALKIFDNKFDYIIHCAGSSSVGFSLVQPLSDFKKSVDSTAEILEYFRIYNPQAKFIFTSSAAVYGSKPDIPINTNSKLAPISPYGYHKMVAENLCKSYALNYHLNIAIVRFFSIYGKGLKKQLIWDSCCKFYKKENSFFGTGKETRDFINIYDAIHLVELILQKNTDFNIYNGASGNRTQIKDVLSIIAAEFNIKSLNFTGKIKTGDPLFFNADINEIKEIGFTSKITLNKGLKEYINWFKSNV